MNALLVSVIALAFAVSAGAAHADPPLVLEQTIALDSVSGRIDHMALDPAGKRLFVAELGNGTVEWPPSASPSAGGPAAVPLAVRACQEPETAAVWA